MLRLKIFFAVLVAGFTLSTGCNVFDGFYAEGESSDPDVLLQDARIALQGGRPGQAVVYLRHAVAKAPERPALRLELAAALLKEHRVDVMDVIRLTRRLAERFEDAPSSTDGLARPGDEALSTCSFDPARADAARLDPSGLENYAQLRAGARALAEARRLVNQVFTGAYDASARFTDVDLPATLVHLRAEGFSNEVIANALLVDAVAYATLAYLAVAEAESAGLRLYHLDDVDGRPAVGYCAGNEESLTAARAHLACPTDDLHTAVRLLHERAALLGSDTAREIADLAGEGYARLHAGLETAGLTCNRTHTPSA